MVLDSQLEDTGERKRLSPCFLHKGTCIFTLHLGPTNYAAGPGEESHLEK